MAKRSEILLEKIRMGNAMTMHEKLRLIVDLSVPSILAQITTVLMFFIDAAMVGHLGAAASASIGLIESTTWLMGSVMGAVSTGFSVQVAHFIGANDFVRARQVFRHALVCGAVVSMMILLVGVTIHGALPYWLGGGEDIAGDSSAYFLIFSLAMPFILLFHLNSAMLKSTGNMHIPSLLSITMCILDVVFNYFFIYILELGVRGAAMGTFCAFAIISLTMMWVATRRNRILALRQDTAPFTWVWLYVRNALRVGLPIAIQSALMSGAQVVSTLIVAPLGNVAIAANSFAITAESLCYMPGYGIVDTGGPDLWSTTRRPVPQLRLYDRGTGHGRDGGDGCGDVCLRPRDDRHAVARRRDTPPRHRGAAHRGFCRTFLRRFYRHLQRVCGCRRHHQTRSAQPGFDVVRAPDPCCPARPHLWVARRMGCHGDRAHFPWYYISLPPLQRQMDEGPRYRLTSLSIAICAIIAQFFLTKIKKNKENTIIFHRFLVDLLTNCSYSVMKDSSTAVEDSSPAPRENSNQREYKLIINNLNE